MCYSVILNSTEIDKQKTHRAVSSQKVGFPYMIFLRTATWQSHWVTQVTASAIWLGMCPTWQASYTTAFTWTPSGIHIIQMERTIFFFVGSLQNINLKVVLEYLSVLIMMYKYFIIPVYCNLLKKLSHTDLTKFIF